MLCLADRGFNGYEHWCSAQATGAQLLWRCAAKRQLPVIKPLPDGSFLSEIRPSKGANIGNICKKTNAVDRPSQVITNRAE
jgi:hypothetical protein